MTNVRPRRIPAPTPYRITILVIAVVLMVAGALALMAGVSKAATGSYVPGFFSYITIGSGARIGPSGAGCDAVSDNAAGTWSARSTGTGSSGTFTLAGAQVTDACEYYPGAAVAATNQGMNWTCKVESTNTIRLWGYNQTAATITPKLGMRCARLIGHP